MYMQLTFNGQRIRHTLKDVSMRPEVWNQDKSLVRKNPKYIDSDFTVSYNTKILSLLESVHRLNKAALKNDIVLTKKIVLDRILNPNNIGIDERSFFSVFDEYIKASKSIKAKRTITGHQTSINFFKQYGVDKTTKLTLFNIDLNFFESLRNYAFIEKGISTNYFARNIATLKAFMTWSLNKGYHSNLEYKKFKAPESEKEIIYLTRAELRNLVVYKFDSPRLTHVRDVFSFLCFTGMRFSDVKGLKTEHISNGFITKSIQKTRQKNTRIGISPLAQKVLDKYEGSIHRPLPVVSSQKFNKYLKECCKLAGINSPIVEIRESGSNVTETTKEKWEVITSHIGRKTFATQSHERGMSYWGTKGTTGHGSEAEFAKYAKLTATQTKLELDEAWYEL